MADPETGHKWWIRYVVVPMIGGGGVVALVVALLNRPPHTESVPPLPIQQASAQQTPLKVTPGPLETQTPAAEAEALVGRWFAALLAGKSDEFVALSGEPARYANEIFPTRAGLRARYMMLAEEKRDVWRRVQIQSIKVQTVRELEESGYAISKGSAFQIMNLTLDDFAVTVTTKSENQMEYPVVVVRRKENKLEVAGMWW